MDQPLTHINALDTSANEDYGDSISGHVLVEWEEVDYRGFVFVLHQIYGLMLLHCTRKESKGPHWQTPGGHVDKNEFLDAGTSYNHCVFWPISDEKVSQFSMFHHYIEHRHRAAKEENTREKQLQLAGKAGVAREMYEETGIDVRSQLERFLPANLRVKAMLDKDGTIVLANEYKHRLFYFLMVTDDDFATEGVGAMGTDKADCKYRHIKVIQRLFFH
jgi:8-oxo-dGTP pyrophosphatase MutT (NUDIX family)